MRIGSLEVEPYVRFDHKCEDGHRTVMFSFERPQSHGTVMGLTDEVCGEWGIEPVLVDEIVKPTPDGRWTVTLEELEGN